MTILLALCALTVMNSAYRIWRDIEFKTKKINELEKRVATLEQTRSTRIPYEVAEYILNARAAISREKEEHQLSLDFLENAEAWMDKAMSAGTRREK